MSVIGSFGDLIFEVTTDKVRTFTDFSRDTTDRWEAHNIIGSKPKSEFIGPGLDTISFMMMFDANHGVNPRQEMEKLLDMSREGQVDDLIIGGKGLGVNLWKIKSLGQKWEALDNHGNVIKATVNVTLEEYV